MAIRKSFGGGGSDATNCNPADQKNKCSSDLSKSAIQNARCVCGAGGTRTGAQTNAGTRTR